MEVISTHYCNIKYNTFQGLNSAELLRLYINHDLLEEAVSLCIEYIDAVTEIFTGQDSQLFQLKVRKVSVFKLYTEYWY